jgi:DNA-binding MarR family transcriptional regulator
VERSRDPADRRNYALSLTPGGRKEFAKLGAVALAHEQAMTAALEPDERAQLASLLRKVAAEQGLTPGVHPGYRRGKADR